jgi:hypothetical protein
MRAGGFMAKVRYGVFQIDSQWLLCCAEHRLGRYADRQSAILAGQRAVGQAIGSGFDAELLILEVGGELRKAELALFGEQASMPKSIGERASPAGPTSH